MSSLQAWPIAFEQAPQGSVTYQISEQPAAMVQEEDFAKQLGLARYLAASSLPPARPLEPVLKGRAPPRSFSNPRNRVQTKRV